MQISITSNDVACSIRGSASQCALALALNRATGLRWFVDYSTAKAWDGEKFLEIVLPQECGARLRAWDRGSGLAPFSMSFSSNLLKLGQPKNAGNFLPAFSDLARFLP